MNDLSFTGPTSIDQLPAGKEKALEPNSTYQLHPVPSSTKLAHPGTASVAHFPTTNHALNRNVIATSQPHLTQQPTPSKFPKFSTNFDRPPTTQNHLLVTRQHQNTANPNPLPKDTTTQAKAQIEGTLAPITLTNTKHTDDLDHPKHPAPFKPSSTFNQNN